MSGLPNTNCGKSLQNAALCRSLTATEEAARDDNRQSKQQEMTIVTNKDRALKTKKYYIM